MTLAEFISAALLVPFRERGRDYAGWDCWGLVRCAYRDVWGIDLPSWDDRYPDGQTTASRDAMKDVVAAATGPAGTWARVSGAGVRDVVVLRVTGRPIHVGLMIDAQRFIHAEHRVGSVIETLASPLWARRIDGIFRYAG